MSDIQPTPQEAAASLGATQAANWLEREHGDVLTGNQVRSIVMNIGAILLPTMKVGYANELADALDLAMQNEVAQVLRDSAAMTIKTLKDHRVL